MKARHVRMIERRANLALLERYDREIVGLRRKQGQPRLIAKVLERRQLVAETLARRGYPSSVFEPEKALTAP